MDKTAIKNFAIWARKKLIADSIYKASLLGITKNGIQNPLPQSTKDIQFFDIGMKDPYAVSGQEVEQRENLAAAIRKKQQDLTYSEAFQSVMEEAAYTWFNRLTAIRFMEVNDYLPSHVRVLSSETPGKTEPDLLTSPFDAGLPFNDVEKQRILQLKNDNKTDELFRMLFIRQCNALNQQLPMLFEKISDYTELLLNISAVDPDGVVWHLVHDIPEDNFNVSAAGDDGQPVGQVEIIGWLYQYYNTEPKNKVFENLRKNVKITRETIPAATQLFTPDWIVRYMVENSLGRLWLEGHPNDGLKARWKYYLDEAEQEAGVQKQLNQIYAEHAKLKPEEITCMDPCCGSGHILVYMFDVLMQIYQSEGYSAPEAAASIVEHNIYGLDIDRRAAQLAYFAVMMKARQYDRRFLTRGIQPRVYAIEESNHLTKWSDIEGETFGQSTLTTSFTAQADALIEAFRDAREYGSILTLRPQNCDGLLAYIEDLREQGTDNLLVADWLRQNADEIPKLVRQAKLLSQKYDVVVTNPPYMGSSDMDAKLSEYVKKNYPDSKSDLCAVFIERCGTMTKKDGYQAMITQHNWMFLLSFEKLREKILQKSIVNMAHLGARAFDEIGGEVVQTASFVLRSDLGENYKGVYCRLIEPNTQQGKAGLFLSGENRYAALQKNFAKIPGKQIAYWVTKQFIENFQIGTLENENFSGGRNKTHNNARYTRLWWEIFNQERWQLYDKGGDFRKWYGNHDYVVDWSDEAKREYDLHGGLYNQNFSGKEGICWTLITSSKTAFRYKVPQAHYDSGSPTIFNKNYTFDKVLLGYLNSIVAIRYLELLNPTMNLGNTYVLSVPYIKPKKQIVTIDLIVSRNIYISKEDWDSFETSWDFIRHPMCPSAAEPHEQGSSQFAASRMKDFGRIAWHYENWKEICADRFAQLKANEEELNRIFIGIYGLQKELTPEEDDTDVTVHQLVDEKSQASESMRKSPYLLTRQDAVKSFLSYAVGCMFGRYSLDVDGLAYAGGEWDGSRYKTFIPDADNVIPITDEEYLDDDIVSRFVQFVKTAYGADALEENLAFIADALGGKGKSSREVIRNYFLKDFFKDHCKTYQKRPIYWLYDSGRQNGFKALVYLHRMNENTTGKVRADYLHRIEQIYSRELVRMQDVIDHSQSAHEVSMAEKRLEKLKKQIRECQDYDAKLGHLALDQIRLNLDDGVKVNYRKAQTARDGKFYEVLADSKNIMASDQLWNEYLTEWPHEDE